MYRTACKTCLITLVAAVLWSHPVDARTNLSVACPGNLLVNGGFEQHNTMVVPTHLKTPQSNSRWAWYKSIPGWYTTRPDGQPCVRVDWQKPYIEVARGALAVPIEGEQYAELLPNGTGNYCQDVAVQKGATYKLTYYYGRLMTGYWRTNGRFTAFDTAIDVAIRPAGPAARAPLSQGPDYGKGARIWPMDKQGFTTVSSADSYLQWQKHGRQWVQYKATFKAPSNKIELAFINTLRSGECGSCGSLLDAVCLVKL